MEIGDPSFQAGLDSREGGAGLRGASVEGEEAVEISIGISANEVAPVDEYPDLPKAVTVLRATGSPFNPGGCEVFLVGTSHISARSCEDVRKVIQSVRPQVVFLELCSERRGILTATAEDLKPQPFSKIIEDVRKGAPMFTALYAWMLGRVGESLDSPVGEEFRTALVEARKVNAKVVLGDRAVSITVARTWAALTLWDKIRFVTQLLFIGISPPDDIEDLEALKDYDELTQLILELGQEFPRLVGPLLTERNQYMVYQLHMTAAKRVPRIVAVVGAGHVQGMKEVWHDDINVDDLVSVPAKVPRIRWGRVALLTGGICLTGVIVLGWRRRR